MPGNPNGSGYLREEDPVEVLIRRTGCWEQHIAVVDCMGEKGDWRQCQVQVQQFKECMKKTSLGSKERNPTMFPDVFGRLEIDNTERVNVRPQFCTPSQYSANIQNIGWFLCQRAFGEEAEQDREIVNHRAAYFHYHKRFKEASEEYKVLLGEYKHSRTHSVAVLDSLVRCALKTLSCPVNDLLRYLHEYKHYILDCGDHLQYLTVAKEVYVYISCEDAPQKFVEVVCLLCATTGLPEHWLAFGEKNLPNMGKNFHIGYVTRAIMLLERQIKGAHGFVVRAMEKKLKSCTDRLAEMGCSGELVSNNNSNALKAWLVELRAAVDGLSRHDKLGQPLTVLVPFLTADRNVTFFKRCPGSNL
ncbi:unnamed protein product [Angiostrongylus costaricensis]|uniref:CHCH domain-containing protein n=1 Tax=Angiostrongylus costaricensis TaxID=334426 RepID=A0A0R3PJ80_ANGCS|nr:unnamed protein product [Angiostrongylus costaricensis]